MNAAQKEGVINYAIDCWPDADEVRFEQTETIIRRHTPDATTGRGWQEVRGHYQVFVYIPNRNHHKFTGDNYEDLVVQMGRCRAEVKP